MKFARPTTLLTGTAGELMKWVEKLSNAAHPDNAIEYWAPAVSDYDREPSTDLRSADPLPERVHRVGVYVRQGNCEGHALEVVLGDRAGQIRLAFRAKVFGKRDDAWELAKTVSTALELIFLYGEQPVLPDLWEKLPRAPHSYIRHTNLWGKYEVSASQVEKGLSLVVVRHESGQEIDRQSFQMVTHADAYASDWMTVLAGQEHVTATRVDDAMMAAA